MNEESYTPNIQTPQQPKTSLFPYPNPGCHHCYGRGVEGWEPTTKQVKLCRCILNKVGKTTKTMNSVELKRILTYTNRLFKLKDNTNEEIINKIIKETDQEYTDQRTDKE